MTTHADRLTTHADRSPFFIALVVVDVLAGLADAISGPYFVLFLVDQARLSPLLLSAVLTARALAGIAFATGFGAWIDRRTSVAPLLLALAGSSVGYALLGFTTNFVLLLVVAAIPIAIGAAAFSQSIALVKRHFDHASPHTANRAIGVLRASWSLAWAIGPAIGAAAVAAFGFRGAFFTSAASGVVALATLALVRARPIPHAGHSNRPKPANGGPAIALAFAALALFHTAMFMGTIPLPIVLTTSLGGTERDVGLAFSLCAGLEIVVMAALIWRPLKRAERPAIMIGFAAFVAYFIVLALTRSLGAGAVSPSPPGDRHRARHLSRNRVPAIALAASRRRSRRLIFKRRVKWVRCSPPSAQASWRRRSATDSSSLHAPFSASRVSLWFG